MLSVLRRPWRVRHLLIRSPSRDWLPQLSRYASEVKEEKSPDEHGPLTHRRTKRLDQVHYHLQAKNPRRALQIVLRSTVPPIERKTWFEISAQIFMEHGDVVNAVRLFQYIISLGYDPSPPLTAQIVDAAAKHSFPFPTEVLEPMAEQVMNAPSPPDPRLFVSVLRILRKIRPHSIVEGVINEYAKRYTPRWEAPSLVAFLIRSSSSTGIRKPISYLQAYRKSSTEIQTYSPSQTTNLKTDKQPALEAGPYVALMTVHFKRYNTSPLAAFHGIRSVLQLLVKDDVTPTLPVFNIAISAANRANLPRTALDLYDVMRKHANHVVPDAFTFATLFKIIDRFDRVRKLIARGQSLHLSKSSSRPPLPMLSGRAIFREMMESHVYRTHHTPSLPSRSVTTSVLNVALAYFMRVRDYGAALVVLRCFAVCRVRLDERTTWNVNYAVLRRANAEMRGAFSPLPGHEGDRLWVERLLGLDHASSMDSDWGERRVRRRTLTERYSPTVQAQLGPQALAYLRSHKPRKRHPSDAKGLFPELPSEDAFASTPATWVEASAYAYHGRKPTQTQPSFVLAEPPDLALLLKIVQDCALAEAGLETRLSLDDPEENSKRAASIKTIMMNAHKDMLPRGIPRSSKRSRRRSDTHPKGK